jgi:hypothetical protein
MQPELRRIIAKLVDSWVVRERHTGNLSEEIESDALAALEQLQGTVEESAPKPTEESAPKPTEATAAKPKEATAARPKRSRKGTTKAKNAKHPPD